MDYNYYNNPIYYPYRASYPNHISRFCGYPPIYFERVDCLKNDNSNEHINKKEPVKEQNNNRRVDDVFESNTNRLQHRKYCLSR